MARWSLGNSRMVRVSGTFFLVLTTYWAYALAVVPWIEPSVSLYRTEGPSESDLASIPLQQQRQIEELKELFPPGSWELDNPKILVGDQVKLLVQEYDNQGDKMILRPCTMVFTPQSATDSPAERRSRAIVLQAPSAVLEFSEAFVLGKMKIGRLIGGRLAGNITIRSNGKLPGPEDDLIATTKDVVLTEEEITTPHPVDFRLGPNYGSGADMHIKFLPGDRQGGARHGPNIAGIESFQLNHLKQLHLVAAGGGLLPTGDKSARGQTPNMAGPLGMLSQQPNGRSEKPGQSRPGAAGLPVELACRGPFRFDVVQQLATFSDHVDVLQIHPDGPSDQLQCELLSIYFARSRNAVPTVAQVKGGEPKPEASGSSSSFDLQPRRVEAQGTPVVIVAPSQDFQARGERAEFDLWNQRVALSGNEEVFLRQGPNEIHARSVVYQPAPNGRLGQAAAQGPGWLRGHMAAGQAADRRDQVLEVRWNDQLRLRPHEQQQVISLSGGADLSFAGMGQLAAREIHFWLNELPGPNNKTVIRPDRMLARQDVRLNATQLSGSVDELQVWFEPMEQPKPQGLAASISNLQAMGQAAQLAQQFPASARVVQRVMAGTDWGPATSGTAAAPGSVATPGTPPAPPAAALPNAAEPVQHFEIVGRLLRARMTQVGMQAELAELQVEGNVRFTETQTARPGEQPLVINGEQIHVIDGSKPSAALTVLGNPAHVEARGLGLTGANINLNRGTNMLWIEGQGRMTLPLDRDLQGRPLSKPGFLDVCWQERMAFDGRTARFEESVVAAAQHQQLETQTLEVAFRQPIRFADARPQTKPEPEKILCRGGVAMKSHSFDERGQSSLERVRVKDMAINLVSGAVQASGPGWMSSVRRGAPANMLELRPGNPLAGALGPESVAGNTMVGRSAQRPTSADPAQTADADKLTYLNVRFQDSILGNLHSRQMAFRNRVQAVYGPVVSWEEMLDVDRPDRLGPEAVLLTCDQLAVAETPVPVGKRRGMELEAVGSTVVEGRSFTARGARMTYDEAKGLLVLEGDGRSDAELFRQQQIGGPRAQTSARKIYYWHRLDQLRVDGARSFDMGPLPSASRESPGPQAAAPGQKPSASRQLKEGRMPKATGERAP